MLRSLRFPLLASLLAFTALTSCKKDDADGLMTIAHDSSVYMRNMHKTMAMMEAMPKPRTPTTTTLP